MRMMRCLFAVVGLAAAVSAFASPVNLGFASGYPPYQYVEAGRPAGLDIEIANALAGYGLELNILQENWDDVVGKLRTRQGVDLVGGMEITEERKALFDFSTPLYSRKNVILVRQGTADIGGLADLAGKLVAGDRGSYAETQLDKLGLKSKVRLIYHGTKEEAMAALRDGKVQAALMPDAVGFFLARKLGLQVKAVEIGDPGASVAFAVRKGNTELLSQVDAAVRKALADKAVSGILARWFK